MIVLAFVFMAFGFSPRFLTPILFRCVAVASLAATAIMPTPLRAEDPTLISSLEELQWESIAVGVWRARIGVKQWTPMEYANAPKLDALAEMGEVDFPFRRAAARGRVDVALAHFRLPLGESERIYGMGLEFKGANRRKQVYNLKVDHYGGVKGFTHAPVPFYVSSAGYGVLINTAQRATVHVGIANRKDSNLPPRIDRTTGKGWKGKPESDAVEGNVQGEGVELIVFAGNSPLEVVQRYNLFSGGGVLPPRWGLGFWHRMHTKSSDEDVRKEIEAFKENDFPLDVIGLEPGWQSLAYPCSFDWDETRFPKPGEFVTELADQGIRVNLWENPYVTPESTMYEGIKPYTGSHTVWLGEVPDYSLAAARAVLLDHHQREHLDLGVSGYKFDEVDGFDTWLWPDHATFPSGHSGVEMRQLYGLLLQRTFMDRFRDLNQRTYGLVRASNAGASAMGFVLYSDYYDHKGYVTALTNCSLGGVLWTPEIRSARSPEEWVRRFQSVAFSPMLLLNAWFSGTKPWSFPSVTDEVRDVINLRLQLMPYLYTAFADYNQKGIPPFRAMILESGFQEGDETTGGELDGVTNPYAEVQRLEKTDQYMMGPSMLVAPVFTGETSRDVVLPRGDWFDFYTGERVGNGETITVQTELSRIPLFVKDGGIIPMMPAANNISQQTGAVPLEVRHYGNRSSSYVLYDDDGETFDHERGEYSQTRLSVTVGDGEKVGSVDDSVGEWVPRYESIRFKYMTP